MRATALTANLAAISASFVISFAFVAESHAAVTISTAVTKNMSCTSGVCTPTAKNAVLNVNDLTNMLASGNVTVNTGSGQLAQQVEDIAMSAGFTWVSASSLSLDAYRSITVNQPISVAGTGAVTLTTNDGGTGGYLFFVSDGRLSFFDTSNNLTINGSAYTLVNTLSSLARAIAANPAGAYAFSANYDASQDGTYPQSPVQTTFAGSFEGLGNTISNITVDSSHTQNNGVGGLFAELSGVGIANLSLSNLTMKVSRTGSAGGIVGWSLNGSVFGVHVSGNIGGGVQSIGGLIGENEGSLDESSSDAKVNDGGHCAGGLVGENDGSITNSFATGKVKGKYVGGLACVNHADITNSYSTGSVSGGGSSTAAGLTSGDSGEILTSYSTGFVSGGLGSTIGGFVGIEDNTPGPGDCYWDTTTSGTNEGTGNEGNVQGLTGLTTTQFKAGLPAGFDPTIWKEHKKINNGFPYLIANPPH